MEKKSSLTFTLRLSRNILFLILAGCSFLLLSVAFFYSVRTPFALIDDYASWLVVKHWLHDGQFKNWMVYVFWNTELTRYRPFFEIYNFTSWTILGLSSDLHHLSRWVIKFSSLIFYVLIVKKCENFIDPGNKAYTLHGVAFSMLACTPLVILFVFFPNQPDARLAPVELNTVLFLGMVNYSIAKLLFRNHQHALDSNSASIIMLVAGFLGLSLSKEINIFLLAWVTVFLFILIRRKVIASSLIALVPLILIFFFTLWRIKIAATDAEYGLTGINMPLLASNFKWIYKEIFQFSTSLAIAIPLLVLFFLPALQYAVSWDRNTIKTEAVSLLILIYGQFFTLLAILCTSWQQVLRYWYPIVPLLAMIASISFLFLLKFRCKSQIVYLFQCLVLLFCLVFLLTNSYNYLVQYTSQHALRSVEVQVLDRTKTLLDQGESVSVMFNPDDPNMELNANFIRYFRKFIPFFHGDEFAVRVIDDFEHMQGRELLISPGSNIEGLSTREMFSAALEYPLHREARRVSAIMQLRVHPRVRLDHGVHTPDSYVWGIFQKEEAYPEVEQHLPEEQND